MEEFLDDEACNGCQLGPVIYVANDRNMTKLLHMFATEDCLTLNEKSQLWREV